MRALNNITASCHLRGLARESEGVMYHKVNLGQHAACFGGVFVLAGNHFNPRISNVKEH